MLPAESSFIVCTLVVVTFAVNPNPSLLFDKIRYDIIVISVPVSSGSDCGDAKELGEERPQTGNGVEVFTSSIVPV